MYCPKCGTQNADGTRYCQSCNSELTGAIQKAQTSGLAIAALVLAILTPFTCMTSALPAIILGIVSLVKISKSSGRLKGTGMAIAGIIVPFVALPITALLMGILIPALDRTRQVAFRMVCATNMTGLSKGMILYASEFDDKYPTAEKWCDLLIEYGEIAPQTFICQGAPEGPSNYAINENVGELGTYTQGDVVLLFETYPGWNQVGGPEILTTDNHEGEGCNVVFVDMSVKFVKTSDIQYLKWKPD